MTVITTRIIVSPDGAISGRAPDLPPGEHNAEITVGTTPKPRLSVRDMPRHDLPWDGSVSLRREDMYDENGRLR